MLATCRILQRKLRRSRTSTKAGWPVGRVKQKGPCGLVVRVFGRIIIWKDMKMLPFEAPKNFIIFFFECRTVVSDLKWFFTQETCPMKRKEDVSWDCPWFGWKLLIWKKTGRIQDVRRWVILLAVFLGLLKSFWMFLGRGSPRDVWRGALSPPRPSWPRPSTSKTPAAHWGAEAKRDNAPVSALKGSGLCSWKWSFVYLCCKNQVNCPHQSWASANMFFS